MTLLPDFLTSRETSLSQGQEERLWPKGLWAATPLDASTYSESMREYEVQGDGRVTAYDRSVNDLADAVKRTGTRRASKPTEYRIRGQVPASLLLLAFTNRNRRGSQGFGLAYRSR
jgi:hypothetical protein